PVSQLYCDRSGRGEMRTAEGIAQIDKVVSIEKIRTSHLHRPVLAERFSDRQVHGCILRQMVRAVAVKEARSICHCSRDPAFPGERSVDDRGERVALVVIKEEESSGRRTEVGETARNCT